MGAHAGRSGHEAKGITADFFCLQGIEWDIGEFHFKWVPESKTLLCLLNSFPFKKWDLKHCDTEPLAREFSANMVTEYCFAWTRAVANFRRGLPPEPRDRHL